MMSQPSNEASAYTNLVLSICFALCTFVTNTYLTFSIEVGIDLSIGFTFVLLAFFTLPFKYALPAFAVSAVPHFLCDHAICTFYTELLSYLFVIAAVQMKVRFISAISAFWVFIGLPMNTLIIYQGLDLSVEKVTFMSFIVMLGGYANALMAFIAYSLIPVHSSCKRYDMPLASFSRIMSELNIISVTLPIIMIALFFTWKSSKDNEYAIKKQLNTALAQTSRSVNGLISDKMHILGSTVKILKQIDADSVAQTLDAIANVNPTIESMILVDKHADVVMAAPERYAAMLPNISSINIAHRRYFQDTAEQHKGVVSRAIHGTGLGDLDIVAFTSPIIINGQFDGLLQAAVRLERLVESSVIDAIEHMHTQILITDSLGTVVYSSEALHINKMDTFVPKPTAHPLIRQLPTVEVGVDSYIHGTIKTNNNWHIHALIPTNHILDGAPDTFAFILIIVFSSAILISILAKGLASNIARPLINLGTFISDGKNADTIKKEARVSIEMVKVTERVIQAHTLASNFQQTLQSQVDEKTTELKELNAALIKLSRTDMLTNIYNRAAFEELATNTYQYCQRHNKPVTIVMIDIDNFKLVNDTYGHSVGDKCLVRVSAELKRMCQRDTDILARYGGEEFIILLGNNQHETHFDYIEQIRRRIEHLEITFNEHSISLTISCGAVSVTDNFALSLPEIIALADEQLYLSKSQGRNQLHSISV